MPRRRIRLSNIQCDVNFVHVPCKAPNPATAPHVLLLHGHSSRVAEFDALIPELEKKAHVYTFDQPCCGASSNVSVSAVRGAYRRVARPPALYYLRELTAEVVNQLVVPHLPSGGCLRVAGGSLGGNLALMIAERGYSWLKDAVVWSPGSAWRGDLFQAIGAPAALGRASESWGARRDEFLEGTFCKNVVDILGIVGLTRPQPWYWYADGWGGGAKNARPSFATSDGSFTHDGRFYPAMTRTKADAIEAAFREAEHDFSNARARWHWEVAGEQLAFSHRSMLNLPSRGRVPRIGLLKRSVRFMAGEHDNSAPADLHTYTRELHDDAAQHVVAPVRVKWASVKSSGHSIHNELPDELARVLTGPIDA